MVETSGAGKLAYGMSQDTVSHKVRHSENSQRCLGVGIPPIVGRPA